jgi:glyoxylase-like metal-dependent hydrolase (beta-lactamase superfamily II)
MSDSLEFPFAVPERAGFTDIAPGVRWIRMPMPYRLDHINVWALDDGDGWTLVDTGMRTQETMAIWEELTSRPPLAGPLQRVIATHWHPDHLGLAGWLTRKHHAPLWISQGEYLMARTLMSDSSREAPANALQFYREAGWADDAVENYRIRFGSISAQFYPLPDSFRRLRNGMRFAIGGNEWEVISGYGHSPEHACLYCASLKLLISGDQVLPRISSNVSVFPLEPDANPMAEWFASMERIKQRVPEDVLVAPAHHDVFRGLHLRIDNLLRSQHEALDRLREMLAEPRRVMDVFPALFRAKIGPTDYQQLGMATGEALANLNYLMGTGEAVREVRDGIAWYRKA